MPRCPYCGRPAALSQPCPACSRDAEPQAAEPAPAPEADLPADETGRKAVIARFQNSAEAGYFADELTRETAIDTEVLARERFDAVHAVWSIDYVLLVDGAEAARAAQTLEWLIESTSDEGAEASDLAGAAGDLPAGVWMPLIITLAAGSIACFGIEAEQRPRHRPPALVVRDPRDTPELWNALGAAPGPWVQRLGEGPGVRELAFEAETRMAVLREDRDGDGRFEREWRFRRPK